MSLDLESLRRQYPEMPGWGERVFLELHGIRESLEDQQKWFGRALLIIAGVATGALPALKGAGLI